MPARWRIAAAAALFVGVSVCVACSGGINAAAPSGVSNQLLNVAGSWTGTSTDSQGFLNGSLTMTRK